MTRQTIKITKKYAGYTLHTCEAYVSNGHWLIPRVMLDPRFREDVALATIGAEIRAIAQDRCEKAIASGKDATRAYSLTGWIYTSRYSRENTRVAIDTLTGDRLYLKAEYCAMFGLETDATIHAEDGNSVIRIGNGETACYLMPTRCDAPDLPTTETIAARQVKRAAEETAAQEVADTEAAKA